MIYLQNHLQQLNGSNMKIPEIFLFDMDGTLYLGENKLEGASELIEKLKQKNIITVFLSNNSSKNKIDYYKKLNKLNIQCEMDDIFTSLSATILKLKEYNIKKIYPVATPSMEKELLENGFEFDDTDPDAIVMGFDKTLNYKKITKTYELLKKGKRYIATHPDILCPTETGFIPDIGSFIAMFEKATGRLPEIIGKPNTAMVETVLKKYGKTKDQCAMVGDRLYTDMRMAIDSNITSILVLSGETKKEDYYKSEMKIDIVVNSVKDLLEYFNL